MDTQYTPAQQSAFDFLGISPETHTYQQGYNRYRYLSKKLHPDKGGTTDEFQTLQRCWELAKPKLLQKILPVVVLRIFDDTHRFTHGRFVFMNHIRYKSPSPMGIWVWYQENGGVFEIVTSDDKQDMPENEHRIQPDVTHRCIFTHKFERMYSKYDPLIVEVSPGELVLKPLPGEMRKELD